MTAKYTIQESQMTVYAIIDEEGETIEVNAEGDNFFWSEFEAAQHIEWLLNR